MSVRAESLDRAGIQTDQERRVAMAIYPPDGSGTGRTPLVGDRHRDLVVALGWRRSRSRARGHDFSIPAKFASTATSTLAVGRYLPSGLDVAYEGSLPSSSGTRRP